MLTVLANPRSISILPEFGIEAIAVGVCIETNPIHFV